MTSHTDIRTSSVELARAESTALKYELDTFLRDTQPRAFRMLQIALRDEQTALDLLQDAMLAFVKRYAKRPAEERAPLFYRIVQNRLRDFFRQQRVRHRWVTTFADFYKNNKSEDDYHLEAISNDLSSDQSLDVQNKMLYIDRVLSRLALRQQQTFLLRAWEGLTEQQTAQALGISVGSVKTHYSRARHALQAALDVFDGNVTESIDGTVRGDQ